MIKRKKMKVKLTKQEFAREIPCREIMPSDSKLLGKLMYAGYKDTIDYENETEGDFIVEIERTFEGQYGPCLYNCSFIIEDNSTPVAASIITLFKGLPLLTYTVTNPKHLNKGYSTYLIRKSMNELLVNGYEDLYLVVTDGNSSAIHIYEKLEFKEVFGEWGDIQSKEIHLRN